MNDFNELSNAACRVFLASLGADLEEGVFYRPAVRGNAGAPA